MWCVWRGAGAGKVCWCVERQVGCVGWSEVGSRRQTAQFSKIIFASSIHQAKGFIFIAVCSTSTL